MGNHIGGLFWNRIILHGFYDGEAGNQPCGTRIGRPQVALVVRYAGVGVGFGNFDSAVAGFAEGLVRQGP